MTQICRECGCTNFSACPGGCWWVEDDLCSACAVAVDLASGDSLTAAELLVPDLSGWTEPELREAFGR